MPDPKGPGGSLPKWQDLGVRTISAAILVPIVLLDVWIGGAWYQLFVLGLGVLMAREWVRLAHADNDLQFGLHALAGMAGAVLPLSMGIWPTVAFIGVVWLISGFTTLRAARGKAWPYLGIPYIAASTLALTILRADPDRGALAILWLLAIVWTADISAYFAGRIIGGPKLAPVLSPKKTWAGAVGACLGGTIAALLVALAAGLGALVTLGLLGTALAVVEQAGDLFKSALKRSYGVKDSGALIPGHGGVLDRIDGLVAACMAGAVIGALHRGTIAAASGLLVW
jgi:phosphatidate cytidylyltransferase